MHHTGGNEDGVMGTVAPRHAADGDPALTAGEPQQKSARNSERIASTRQRPPAARRGIGTTRSLDSGAGGPSRRAGRGLDSAVRIILTAAPSSPTDRRTATAACRRKVSRGRVLRVGPQCLRPVGCKRFRAFDSVSLSGPNRKPKGKSRAHRPVGGAWPTGHGRGDPAPAPHPAAKPAALALGILAAGGLRGGDRASGRVISSAQEWLTSSGAPIALAQRAEGGPVRAGHGPHLVQRAGFDHRLKAPVDAVGQPVAVGIEHQRGAGAERQQRRRRFRPANRPARVRWCAALPRRAECGRGCCPSMRAAVAASSSASIASCPARAMRTASASARISGGHGGDIGQTFGQRAQVKPGPADDDRAFRPLQDRGHLAQPMADRIVGIAGQMAVKQMRCFGLVRGRGRADRTRQQAQTCSASALTITPPCLLRRFLKRQRGLARSRRSGNDDRFRLHLCFQVIPAACLTTSNMLLSSGRQNPAGLSARARLNPPPISSILRAIDRGGKGSRT